MKALFALTPAESKRLIAKAVVRMPQMQAALEKAYVILGGGTTNAFIAEELLGKRIEAARFTAGICTNGLMCVTPPADRVPFPVILHKGNVVQKTIREALDDFHKETVVIKGANAVDLEGNVGVITAGFDGGTVPQIIGTVTSQGLTLIAPVGLEKLVPSVKESSNLTGAKTFDYCLGADFGMFCLVNAKVVTEIEALRILFGVEAKMVASGGVGGSEGAVVLAVNGDDSAVRATTALVEAIKGEQPVKGLKAVCEKCRYACRFAGTKEADLPAWVRGVAAQ
ncbi:MAG TPA: hypothetical protein VF889_04540 [Bacteroidota bacterium]